MRLLLFCIFTMLFVACCSTFFGEKVNLSIKTDKRINRNIYNKSSPVVIVVYQLKTDRNFKAANIVKISSEDQSLANDIVSKTEIEVLPGKILVVKENILPEAHYFAIISEFRNPEKNSWKEIINIKNIKKSTISIFIKNNKMTINGG